MPNSIAAEFEREPLRRLMGFSEICIDPVSPGFSENSGCGLVIQRPVSQTDRSKSVLTMVTS